ncbi:MAG TPA: peptide-methionine (S)-S-oxide reductase MsrA [Terriglobales bacterium]|jgi:peptide-methionine (S)-S-oxide reductase|nr:peptide-methionine (S)-S-oxide reductase MsrA [Terriglobales bacterium]
MPTETAILAGGCFWCLEAVFDRLRGVHAVESGYIGGHVKNPAYREVCAGTTGHAEAVRITFDPAEITFADLLEVFFAIHDPTTKDRQGNDVGTQYRSAIFYTSEEQKRAAEEKIKQLTGARAFGAPIVTEVALATAFYEAEGYHQEYFENNPAQPYCQMVVAPKVRKALEKFGEKMAAK